MAYKGVESARYSLLTVFNKNLQFNFPEQSVEVVKC